MKMSAVLREKKAAAAAAESKPIDEQSYRMNIRQFSLTFDFLSCKNTRFFSASNLQIISAPEP
jgi:hypothetical protein